MASVKRAREGDEWAGFEEGYLAKRTIHRRSPHDWNWDQDYDASSNGDSENQAVHDLELDPPGTETGVPASNICYGALFDVKAQVTSTLDADTETCNTPWALTQSFEVSKRESFFYLLQKETKSNKEFAILDLITSQILRSIQDKWAVTYTAIIPTASLKGLTLTSKRKKVVLELSVNIYGPESLVDEIGDRLAEFSKSLQHPGYLERGIHYINPHYFYLSDQKTDLRDLIGPVVVPEKTCIERELGLIFDSFGDLPSSIANTPAQQCDIHRISSHYLVNTQLKSHQIDGVKFILNREDPTFCHKAQEDILNLIDSRLREDSLTTCLGGILADVMGLGKTMTMLSAIVLSKITNSADLSTSRMEATNDRRSAQQTLIVLPSSQVLGVWSTEIKARFLPNTLKVSIFYGNSRDKNSASLPGSDVVLTTYHTLSADWKRRGILQTISWFRVVLDEAHYIRNQSTDLFKSVANLQCERRWCLTGTPIQNSLDDLRSLLKFLRFEPFCTPRLFEEYILAPARPNEKSDYSLQNLKLLLRAICLRRTETQLELPPTIFEEVSVVLNSDETAGYQGILSDCQKQFDKLAGAQSEKKKYGILFTTVMKLRRHCNHGTIQPHLISDSINSMSQCRLVVPQTPKMFLEHDLDDVFCESCGTTTTEGLKVNISPTGDYFVCDNCLRDLKGGSSETNSPISSSFTSNATGSPFGELPVIHSSKLTALLGNLFQSCVDPTSKSIVFSSWCSTLDILANMLRDRGIQTVQIDGRVPAASRSTILSRFSNDPSIRVILMSIGTGAVGLTLTNANFIHIVEPQWNPAVEEQAIARAVRMGQKRSVTVFKYITEHSVEKNIVKLQKSKSRLAKYSLQDNEGSFTGGGLDDLKFILSTDD